MKRYLIDSHTHIHESDFPISLDEVWENMQKNEVKYCLTVGTDVEDSRRAVEFAHQHAQVFALVGVHPHDVKGAEISQIEELLENNDGTIVGLGDIGLDYHYESADPAKQQQILRQLLNLAVKYDLPVSFHVRDAFADFWPIFDEFHGKIKGSLHSFTDSAEQLQEALKRGLKIGVNGIATFAPEVAGVLQQAPIESLIVETDAPWLAPKSKRGKPNEPAYVLEVANWLAKVYNVGLDQIQQSTTQAVEQLYQLDKQ